MPELKLMKAGALAISGGVRLGAVKARLPVAMMVAGSRWWHCGGRVGWRWSLQMWMVGLVVRLVARERPWKKGSRRASSMMTYLGFDRCSAWAISCGR